MLELMGNYWHRADAQYVAAVVTMSQYCTYQAHCNFGTGSESGLPCHGETGSYHFEGGLPPRAPHN